MALNERVYEFVSALTATDLADAVTAKLRQGFKIAGGPIWCSGYWSQAVWK